MDFIVDETNIYGPTNDATYVTTDSIETREFLALIIPMEHVHLQKLEDYWSVDSAIGGDAICSSVMIRASF